MIILGLSPTAHESAVGILVDGRLVAAASEERFSRVKNQGGFPTRALEFCLKRAGIEAKDVDHVAYAALPFQKERLRDVVNYGQNLRYVSTAGGSAKSRLFHLANYARALAVHSSWLTGKNEELIRGELQHFGLDQKLVFVDHHLSHCAAAYFTSGFERTLVVSLDGYGSGNAGSFYLGEGGKLTLLSPIPYPHSLGTFYRRVTQALGFKPNRHEGKIVGLAAFGDPSKLYDRVRARFNLEHDDYFRFTSAQDPFFEKELVAKYSREDIAAAYQRVLEDVAVHYVKKWLARTGATRVACAGGVFANVKMNQRIMEIDGVEKMFVFPAMSDAGVGVGAAYALSSDLGKLTPEPIADVYLGPSYSDAEIEKALRASGLSFWKSANAVDEIVDRLVKNKVVARFGGAMEFGPRALGNRSILYPALEPEVNKWLNDRLKRTEFMPFAPISLAERASDLYVNIDRVMHSAEFMTVTTDCTPRMRAESPAAVHVDGTARPQLVRADRNPTVHAILKRYEERTKIPTLINTSFNMHEEPIVCSPDDAIRAFKDGNLEVLSLGDYLVESTTSAADGKRPGGRSAEATGHAAS
ncbi:MAG: carbamoyltransferase C-terminal domain-containing protein [Polyangiaceae bacterium]